jgi:asparagine synthase (glutamine-hydrolysing)
MCGICGIMSFHSPNGLRRDLERMLKTIDHRGTATGAWICNDVALGTRRLPIIDLQGSSQPLFNEDGSIALVGNGEIYNFRELRNELHALGHKFRTDGDLESILHLYESYGNGFWQRLRGQFAVALYDISNRRMILARDHLGIIPLFYQQSSSCFLFGSEIKAIAAHPSFQKDLNPTALADFLCLQFVPKPQTVYQNVRSLPPGSLLTLEDGKETIRSFWSVHIKTDGPYRSREDLAQETKRLLRQSVSRTLISDVPVGILLSGGLDSSGIAALAAQITRKPFHTFAIVFEGKSFDESPYSREMAGYIGSQHHEVVLDEHIILESLSKISECFDEPFAEGSAFPIYHVCRIAKEFVTVVLSGEGADEIFCGYEPYAAQQFLKYYRSLPKFIRRALRAGVHRLPVSDSKVSWDFKLRRFVEGAEHPPAKAHFWWRCSMNDSEKQRILNGDFLAEIVDRDTSRFYEERYDSFPSEDIIARIMAADCTIHMPDDLLLRANLMSMAHTLELRVPYLDVDLVDYAFTIASRHKLRGFTNKMPLRDALQGVVPERIRSRPKQGLNMPYQKWFKRRRWKELLHDTLDRTSVKQLGIFNGDGIQTMLAEHERETHNHAHALWATMNLVLWLKAQRVEK